MQFRDVVFGSELKIDVDGDILGVDLVALLQRRSNFACMRIGVLVLGGGGGCNLREALLRPPSNFQTNF